ncbi:MAG: NAD(P)-binding protein, partial [Anaerolineales bacterium]|nr:NAD(P)-binding protein [Anaerolineales bacterium]
MSEVYDAIVIGAGHNGLVTAAYLSRAGLRTLVIEERGVIGGAASSEEFIEGYIFSPGADEAALLVPDIIDDLRLRRWGLAFHESPTALTALNPGGKPLTLWRDSDRNQAELQNGPGREGERLAAFLADSERYNQLVGEMMRLPPPEIAKGLERAHVTPWLNPALRLRGMG